MIMIQDRDNRKDFLFSALIVGICMWAFSTIGATSYSATHGTQNQIEQVVRFSTSEPGEFVASVNTFPFNGNSSTAIIDLRINSSLKRNCTIFRLNSLINAEYISCNRKSIDIKPEISKTSMDYILSSNMGVEYQSIS